MYISFWLLQYRESYLRPDDQVYKNLSSKTLTFKDYKDVPWQSVKHPIFINMKKKHTVVI